MTLRDFLKFTPLGRWVVIPYRFFVVALPHAARQMAIMLKWAFQSREHYNHSYELTDLNQMYLNSFVAVISGHELAEIRRFSSELIQDEVFRERLKECARTSRERYSSDIEPRYGRRVGWYALVRAKRPRVVVETGVDKGLGTAVIAAALKRNEAEGHPGSVYATDIVPGCGHLVPEEYKRFCRIVIGDSVTTLKSFSEPVDIFIHDSDHRPEYEWAEFEAIRPRLKTDSLVLSDNSQQTSKLLEFAVLTGRRFLFFQDVPKSHWWQGDGIGAAFVASNGSAAGGRSSHDIR